MYCSHIIGKTWVVSRTVIQFLQTYWDKHPKDWDEQLQHMQCIKSPFETCFCYLLKSHVDFYFGTKDVRGGHHNAKKNSAADSARTVGDKPDNLQIQI